MSETIIDLLRDGDIDEPDSPSVFSGVTDRALTKVGRAKMLAHAANYRWDAVLSSPLKRCAGVARGIAKKQGISCKIRKELSEYNYGTWENKPVAEVIDQSAQLFEAFMQDPLDSPPPGAAPYQLFLDEVLRVWTDILANYQGKRILVVTHGGPMRLILGEVLAMQKQAHLRIEVPSACFTRIRSLGPDWPTMLVFHNAQSVRISDLENQT